jgi:hypothetical protein
MYLFIFCIFNEIVFCVKKLMFLSKGLRLYGRRLFGRAFMAGAFMGRTRKYCDAEMKTKSKNALQKLYSWPNIRKCLTT